MIRKELIYHSDFRTIEELFKGASEFLVSQNLATTGIEQALLEREKKFPTGLPSTPPSAIPHTDGTYAKANVILCIINNTPLNFHVMGSIQEETTQVKVIFILMMTDIVTHLDQLQYLIEKVRNTNLVERLLTEDEATVQCLINTEL